MGEEKQLSQQEIYLKSYHRKNAGMTSHPLFLGGLEGTNSTYHALANLTSSERALKILDLACGDGYLLELMSGLGSRESQFFGVDFSEEEIEAARKRLKGLGPQEKYQLNLGRVQNLPHSSGSMDFVTSHMAFMLMDDTDLVVSEIHRVLKSGGQFCALIPKRSLNDPIITEFRDQLKIHLTLEGKEKKLLPLGDPRLSSGNVNDIISLFPNSLFKSVSVEPLLVKKERTVDNVVSFYLTFYGPDLLSPEGFQKLKNELTTRYKNLTNANGFIEWKFETYLIQAQKI